MAGHGKHAKTSPTASPVRKLAAAVAALALGLFAPLVATAATPAEAASLGGISTQFEIDGNMAGAGDWDGVSDGVYGPYTTASGHASTGVVDVSAGTEYCEGGALPLPDDVLVAGQKLDGATRTLEAGTSNSKSDLCEVGAAYEIVEVDGQFHTMFYQYWTRAASGTGDLTVYQELLGPNPASRFDDVLIEFDYNSSGPAVDVNALRWNGSVYAPTSIDFQAGYGTNGAAGNVGTFGESAIDLTASGLLSSTECQTFSLGAAMSRTGNDQNANLQDFFGGLPGMQISNCGSLTVQKVVNGVAPDGLTFPYVVSELDGAAVHGAGGAAGPVADTDASTSSISADIAAGGSHTWNNVLASPDYRVAEIVADLPTGVTGVSVVCTYQDWLSPGQPSQEVTVWEDGDYTGSAFPVFPTSIGAAAPVCVITNQVTSLTLDKIVVNDDGGTAAAGDFTLMATPTGGGAAVIDGTDTDSAAGSTLASVVAPGTYTLSESSLAGYTGGTWSCVGGTIAGDVVTVAEGAAVVCTVVNDDEPAQLTLVKDVTNDDGGTLGDDAFTLTATSGSTTISGITGSGAVTNAEVSAGTWTLGETAVPGYLMTGVACWTDATETTAITVIDGAIDLANGASAYCVIANDDQPGTLELVKEVVTLDGGDAEPGDWTLTAVGPTTPLSGAGGFAATEVDAGAYVLSESSGPSGYEPGAWVCEGGALTGDTVTVPLGGTVTCTITNDDIAPTLTLVKTVVTDDGGDADPTEWTLSATSDEDAIFGVTGSDAVTGAAVLAGTYALAEADGPDGYAAGDWVCEGGAQDGASITLGVGQSAVCTIENDDIPATLTLEKVVENDDGGTAVRTDWTLTATGTSQSPSGAHGSDAVTTVEVDAGVYELSEADGPDGYAASEWSCTDGVQLEGSTLTLAEGQTTVCTITNDDIGPTLTLVKTVVNDNGGDEPATAWTLAVQGPTPFFGTTGDASVTAVPVDAGTYDLVEMGPSGYSAGDWVCVGGSQDGASVAIAPGQAVTCTIENDDIAPTITLVKEVTNDDGGTAAVTDWTLHADSTDDSVSGVSGSDDVTGQTVDAGTFTLSESDGPAGYIPGDWSCTVGALDGGQLTLTPGQSTTCTIVNDDQPGELTLIKLVENDAGGTSVDTEWTLTAESELATVSGVTGDGTVTDASVPAGDYALSEADGPGGYTPTVWVCEGGPVTADGVVTVANGADVTCTITNQDIAPLLTLIKTVVNDDGGGAAVADWTLTADGTDADISGVTGSEFVTGAALIAGSYELSETGPAGYTAGDWVCDGGTLQGSTLTLGVGDDVTCTIVNDDIAPLLTLVKEVVNDDGGEAVASEWMLGADGATPISGASGDDAITAAAVDAGSYTLSESGGPSGYTAGDWACDAGTLEGDALTLSSGDVVTCTIVNDDEPIDLAIDKDDGGAMAEPGTTVDYTITVTNVGARDVDSDEPVTVVDELPAGLSFASGPEACTAEGQTVTCEVDPTAMTAGASVVLVLTVMVDADAPAGVYVNVATVTTEDDIVPEGADCDSESNNIDCDDTPIVIGMLTAEKSAWELVDGIWIATDGEVDFGDTVQYRIEVTAGGDGASRDVVVVDTLQDGLTSTEAATCSIECTAGLDAATGEHRIELGTMQPGDSVVITFTAKVPAAPSHGAGTTVTEDFDNVAAVASATMPETPTNTVTVSATDILAPTPVLPRTGGEVPVGLIGVAMALMVAGGLLMLRRREDAAA
ncbi:LPXTG cell wall anchor domain-containing protein [Agrococcus sp. KRD186]|uniref:LPXTG cell wall anchor domain-containing protein n=1 Tax=Agrococcus sp. KRD186 TaxID=2729730 RepID=UPI0019D30106|nr:LPXTG cell wall anchor domain-containing protein [Agrococcus sp. KRD186]